MPPALIRSSNKDSQQLGAGSADQHVPTAAVASSQPGLEKLTVVLDIDETLCHTEFLTVECTNALSAEQLQYIIKHVVGENGFCFVHKQQLAMVRTRPFLREFLRQAAEVFDLVAFTAAEEDYAREVIKRIDPNKALFCQCLYRQHCTQKGRVKDLGLLKKPLERIVLVDNSYSSFMLQVNNGVPIAPFTSDTNDRALLVLWSFLTHLVHVPDVRNVLANVFRLHDLLSARQ